VRDTGGLRAVEVCTGYDEASHFKDPGLIAGELQRLGYNVTCLVSPKGLGGVPYARWPVELVPGTPGATTSWDSCPADVFLVYFINGPQLQWLSIIRRKSPHARIILKCDSDGLVPAGEATVRSKAAKYQRDLAWFREIASPHVIFQRPAWKAPLRIASRLAWLVARVRLADRHRIPELREYLESFDRIVIESTEAARNLLLTFPSVADRTVVVPDGVLPRSSSLLRGTTKSVVMVGRFTDHRQKRPLVAWRVLRRFLENQPAWTVDIVGPYDATLARIIDSAQSSIRQRVRLHGSRSNEETRAIMADSSICFSASAFESFGIAMAEALCEGCSVVSTPVPSAWDLVADGRSGTVAATFGEVDLLAALLADAEKWVMGKYDRTMIATYWRPRLEWTALVQLILGTNESDKAAQVKEA
jgi:glycosyltransferase involved in cell wall biosynthesis